MAPHRARPPLTEPGGPAGPAGGAGRRDGIFALSTAPGRAAIAVIRLSGPGSGEALDRLTGGRRPPPRRFSRRRLVDAQGGTLDDAVVVWLPSAAAGPKAGARQAAASYTGEDMAELQVHGGPAVLRGLLGALSALPGFRPAEPGEFTRRAFESGRIDLLEAEAVADLVAAETETQRRQALAGSRGALSARLGGWEETLLQVSARVEATIDFADEELPADLWQLCRRQIAGLQGELEAAVAEVSLGERLRQGFEVALVGAPNAGKSSLLNALARREVAIVHEVAGTTRDVVEVRLELGGLPVTLLDTAGLRDDPRDPVEREGMRRARARAAAADLVLALFDGDIWPAVDPITLDLVDDRCIPVITKGDRTDPGRVAVAGRGGVVVSAVTGQGLGGLEARLAERLGQLWGAPNEGLFSRERHRAALADCAGCLAEALAAPEPGLAAEDLRRARAALGRLVGRFDVERLLDRIFGEFCIGK